MGKSSIEWTEHTWQVSVGCDKVSSGCAHSYAETMAARLKAMALADIAAGKDPGRKRHYIDAIDDKGRWSGKLIQVPEALADPLGWRKPRRVFVNSMSDLFHEDLPDDFIDQVFATMAIASQHTFQVLTKRSERLADYFHDKGWPRRAYVNDQARMILGDAEAHLNTWPLSNAWVGCSAENQIEAIKRHRGLTDAKAAIKFWSLEPLLGPIEALPLKGISWVVVGGESGSGARPCDVAWIRNIIEQCREASVSCFVKQLGSFPVAGDPCGPPGQKSFYTANHKLHLIDRKGGDPDEWDEDLCVREFPQPEAANV